MTAADVKQPVTIEVALCQRLGQIIDQTEAEFNRLGPYVQPLVRGCFEAKTGQPIAEWRDTAANLTTLLESVRASDEMAEAIFCGSYPCLKDWLGKLIAYYCEAPAEMASFTRDARLLRDVAFYSPQRETSLHFLLDALERLAVRAHTAPQTDSAQ